MDLVAFSGGRGPGAPKLLSLRKNVFTLMRIHVTIPAVSLLTQTFNANAEKYTHDRNDGNGKRVALDTCVPACGEQTDLRTSSGATGLPSSTNSSFRATRREIFY